MDKALRSSNRRTSRLRSLVALTVTLLPAALGCNGSGSGPGGRSTTVKPGTTSFDSEEGVNGAGTGTLSRGGVAQGAANGTAAVPGATMAGPGASKDAVGTPSAPAPMGRTAAVEEADIYRVDKNRLFTLNTYKGFLIYDLADAKNPKRLSQLPVYGYPIEMFVQGNVVYALLRDVLYMSQVSGKVQFERRDVSQLVAIDISDLAHPRVLKAIDIVGQLREGVSRKIENTIYVVSYIPQSYYWGWAYELTNPQTEQAWVYSFNVADPANLQLVQKLKIFEGGSVNDTDPVTGGQVSRSFSDVAISATSNALMVVENWYLSSWSPSKNVVTAGQAQYTCGSYAGDQRAVVSLIDVSDPSGVIRLHTKFQTRGQLDDQFKQTYVFDDATKKGTYYGIFLRQAWSSSNCAGASYTQNTMESWDVSDGNAPVKLSSLDFGKPNETVRGTAFDVTRQVAYAVTAQSIDPLYALSFADPAHLAVRSSIDGLSGSVSLFRLVEGNQFLVGIGQDTSQTCTGFQGSEAQHGVGMAVSLIDVRNLDAIRLVQRQCVAVNGDWVSSPITWNMDQAHKMIGMQSDGTTTVITVPVTYEKQSQDNSWWWYRTETAVGIMSYDVSKFDPAKAPADQNVIQNYGTLVHPNGEVKRSIVFTHEDPTMPRRMLINLSDTHISIADIQDLQNPVIQSVVEVAPYVDSVFAYGDAVVESITDTGGVYYAASSGITEFRVRSAGSDPETGDILARFSVAGVQNVVPHGKHLIVFRTVPDTSQNKTAPTTNVTNVLVWDLTDPSAPTQIANINTTESIYPYYPYFCGVGGGYWFWYGGSSWVSTDDALVFLGYTYDYVKQTSGQQLTTLDLAKPDAPLVYSAALPVRDSGWSGLVPDGADPSGFFINVWDSLGYRKVGDVQLQRTRHYAERWHRATNTPGGPAWEAEPAVNLPGTLIQTWKHSSGARAYLTTDVVNYQMTDSTGVVGWRSDTQLNLLRGLTGAGQTNLAELMDTARFSNQSVTDLVVEGNALLANVNPNYGYVYYGAGGAVPVGASATAAPSRGVTTAASALTLDDVSSRLVSFDMKDFTLNRVYDEALGTQYVQFMGTHNGQLYMNISGDGILDVDVSDPAHPAGKQFLRTLGWGNTIAFAGDETYVASGNFGLYRFPRDAASSLPIATPLAITGP